MQNIVYNFHDIYKFVNPNISKENKFVFNYIYVEQSEAKTIKSGFGKSNKNK